MMLRCFCDDASSEREAIWATFWEVQAGRVVTAVLSRRLMICLDNLSLVPSKPEPVKIGSWASSAVKVLVHNNNRVSLSNAMTFPMPSQCPGPSHVY
jgi:hypothetical protein